MVINAKIADILVGKPDGLHIEELANLSGLDSGKLGRVLRMNLAMRHCFQEGRAKLLDFFSKIRTNST